MNCSNDDLVSLALLVVEILDKRCKVGPVKPPWEGFYNANGREVGADIERLIGKAKQILQTYNS